MNVEGTVVSAPFGPGAWLLETEDGARYAGRLAEVAIYDRALSRQEVRAHFLAIQCGL